MKYCALASSNMYREKKTTKGTDYMQNISDGI